MKKLRVGVIGAGGIAEGIHMPALKHMENVELAAVCDCVREKAQKLAEKFEVPKWYENYRDMLEMEYLDAVYVLTQPDQLFRITIDCLRSGKHVFMEKPMGLTVFQAESIREEALNNHRSVYVGYNRRYIPVVTETLKIVKERTAINHVAGYFYKDSSPSFYDGCGSSFVCDVIHVIDLVRHIANDTADCRNIKAGTLEMQPKDGGAAYAWFSVVQFENGVTADIRANYETGARVHQFEIHGPGVSAYISLGYGGAECEARILLSGNQKSHSQAVNGAGVTKEILLDGRKLAESEDYWKYYGYYAEGEAFIKQVLEHPEEADAERLDRDAASVRLMQHLLDARF